MTNKYLEKIAARVVANKVELEPGVYYNLDKHELTPTPAHMNEFLAKKDTHSRLGVGAMLGASGGILGFAAGQGRFERAMKDATPVRTVDTEKYYRARDAWEMKKPLNASITDRVYSTGEYGRWAKSMPNVNQYRVEIPGKPSFLSNLAKNRGERFAKIVARSTGGGIGGLLLGGAGYLVGGLTPMDKPILKDAYIDKLEQKYEKKIDELEGWDDY